MNKIKAEFRCEVKKLSDLVTKNEKIENSIYAELLKKYKIEENSYYDNVLFDYIWNKYGVIETFPEIAQRK